MKNFTKKLIATAITSVVIVFGMVMHLVFTAPNPVPQWFSHVIVGLLAIAGVTGFIAYMRKRNGADILED